MSDWIGPMKYKTGFKYQLTEDYHLLVPAELWPADNITTDYITLSTSGELRIKNGYAWDGPSGPTLDSTSAMVPSLVHDALYQLMRMELLPLELRPEADDLFRVMCLDRGMWKLRAHFWYRALRKHGEASALPENVKEDQETV